MKGSWSPLEALIWDGLWRCQGASANSIERLAAPFDSEDEIILHLPPVRSSAALASVSFGRASHDMPPTAELAGAAMGLRR
jgi:hypothetical protein